LLTGEGTAKGLSVGSGMGNERKRKRREVTWPAPMPTQVKRII
jgi:hypothetical protein